ncbi:MAG: hypothetical protein AAB556_01500 [Patescibacteria group bacterium]
MKGTEKGTFRIFKQVEESGVTLDHAILEWSYGCDGEEHAGELHKIFYEGDSVVFAEVVVGVKQGPCDGRCFHKPDLGFFILTPVRQPLVMHDRTIPIK